MTRGATTTAIEGQWLVGPNRGMEAEVVDFRAGNLVAVGPAGQLQFGPPQSFRAQSGAEGDDLMRLLLPNPSTTDLYRGAMRESLANIWSTSELGHVDTRAWENLTEYIVDNGEGCLAFIRFMGRDCVGIAYSDDPHRSYALDSIIPDMPSRLRQTAREICGLPFFVYEGKAQCTAAFWSNGDELVGAEPWHEVYKFSGDVLRGELLHEAAWRSEAEETHEMPQ